MPEPGHAAAARSDQESLLERIRAGDRDAAAEFVHSNAALLRRRYRHKIGSALRRLIDSEDLVATVSRRLDAYVLSGRARVVTLQQLWALIQQIVEHSMADKGRLLNRLRRAEAEEAELAAALEQRVEATDEEVGVELQRIVECVKSPVDREIVMLWLAGLQLKQIAVQLGMSEANVRKRWERTRTKLRRHLQAA